MKEFLEKQSTVFDLCIEQLKPDLKTYYKSLAVFSEDVNITPMVSIEDSLQSSVILTRNKIINIFLL